jgi:hypothetical protein
MARKARRRPSWKAYAKDKTPNRQRPAPYRSVWQSVAHIQDEKVRETARAFFEHGRKTRGQRKKPLTPLQQRMQSGGMGRLA